MRLILASKSPRRREILEGLEIPFDIVSADTDESCDLCDPSEYVRTLAVRKAEAVRDLLGSPADTLIIASDTVVAVENEILGKPQDRADAERMLRLLADKKHEVISGVALILNGKTVSAAEITKVVFGKIEEAELIRYLDSDDPYDKAGAYAIQGFPSIWIRGIEGDYFNVVGFPTHRFRSLLRDELGIALADLMK